MGRSTSQNTTFLTWSLVLAVGARLIVGLVVVVPGPGPCRVVVGWRYEGQDRGFVGAGCRSCGPIQVWTAHQLGTFLTTARNHRLFAFYRLAAYTGARRGELLYLRWEAINLDAAEVTFGGSTAMVRGQRVEGTTEGGRSRTISLDRDTVAVLRDHRRQQAEDRLAAGSAWTDTGGLVFTARWGEPLYPDTVTALMTKRINRHNKSVTPSAKPLPHARLHDLRHLHATTLLLAGVPVHVVAARLGHAHPAVTLRVYAHVLREHAAGAGDIFAQAVNGAR